MAVKLMLAPAIAKGELDKPTRAASRPAAPAKPKRRRSSVYDADGNEVFITLMCLKCHKMRPLAQFGLRKMADGAIRNQPWCRSCRGAAGEKPRREEAAVPAEPSVAEAPSSAPVSADASPAEAPRRTGSVAAEVAAALAGGRR